MSQSRITAFHSCLADVQFLKECINFRLHNRSLLLIAVLRLFRGEGSNIQGCCWELYKSLDAMISDVGLEERDGLFWKDRYG